MAISVTTIGTQRAASGSNATATVGAGGVPIGALLIIATLSNANSAADGSIADSASNSYTKISRQDLNNVVANGNGILWYKENCAALVNTNTIVFTPGAAAVNGISACYATGCLLSGALDTAVTAAAFGSSTTPSVTSGTPGVAGELFVAVGFATSSTISADAAWTAPPDPINTAGVQLVGGNIVNAGTGTKTHAPTLLASTPWANIVVGFKPTVVIVVGRPTPTLFRPDKGNPLRGLTPIRAFPPDPNILTLEVGRVAPNLFRPYQGPRKGLVWPQAYPPDALAITLSGVFATAGVGSFGSNIIPGLTGGLGTGSAGSFADALADGLGGVSATGSPGSFGLLVIPSLTGVVGTGSAASFVEAVALALAGVLGTAAAGSFNETVIPVVLGVSATGAAGSFAEALADALAGVAGVAAVGSFGPEIDKALAGALGAGAAGIFGIADALGLLGVLATGSPGSLAAPTIIPGLAGAGSSGNAGDFNFNASLTGVGATGSPGSLLLALANTLAGVVATGQAGTFTIAGPGGASDWIIRVRRRRGR